MSLPNMRRGLFPLSALVLWEICAFLLVAANGHLAASVQVVAIVILIGIGAAAGAIGITAAQTKGDRVDERMDMALSLGAGATPSDVDKGMEKKAHA